MMRTSIAAIVFGLSVFVTSVQAQDAKPEVATSETPGVVAPTNLNRGVCAARFYTSAMARAKEQGIVTLAMIVGVDGIPQNVAVISSSGFTRLDNAAMACVSGWRYTPATKDGQPIRFMASPTVEWKLH